MLSSLLLRTSGWVLLMALFLTEPLMGQEDWNQTYAKELTVALHNDFSSLPFEAANERADSVLTFLQDAGLVREELLLRIARTEKCIYAQQPDEGKKSLEQALSLMVDMKPSWARVAQPKFQALFMATKLNGYTSFMLDPMLDFLEQDTDPGIRFLLEEGLATLYMGIQDFSNAGHFYQQSIKTQRNLPNPDTMSIAYSYLRYAIGWLYYVGDNELAIRKLDDALDLLTAKYGENHPRLLIYYTNKSRALDRMGRKEEAMALMASLQKKWSSGAMPLNGGGQYLLFGGLGRQYLSLDQLDSAAKYTELALAQRVHSYGSMSFKSLEERNSLARIYGYLGRFEEAEAMSDTAIAIAKNRKWNNDWTLADAYMGRSMVAFAKHDFDGAIEYVHRCMIQCSTKDDGLPLDQNITLDQCNNPGMFLGVTAMKARYLLQAYSVAPADTHLLRLTWQTSMALFDGMKRIRQWKQFPAMYSNQFTNFPLWIQVALEAAVQLYTVTGDAKWLERALVLNEQMKATEYYYTLTRAGKSAGLPDSITQVDRELRVQVSIAMDQKKKALRNQDDEALFQAQEALALANQSLDSLQSHLHQFYPQYHALKFPDSVFNNQVFQTIIPDQQKVVLSYFLGDSNTYVFVFGQNRFEVATLPPKDKLVPKIEQFKALIADYNGFTANPSKALAAYIAAATELYDVLVPASIRPAIADHDHLFVFPHGALTNLPFEALLTQAVDHAASSFQALPYLARQHSVSYGASAMVLLHQSAQRQATRQRYLGFAPRYDAEYLAEAAEQTWDDGFRNAGGALWGNTREVSMVSKRLGGRSYLQEQATESRFKQEAKQASVLHLAMHGWLSDDSPLDSKLIFSREEGGEDGFLHAHELFSMSLQADLAVLSSCHSGAGTIVPGEGAFSLARAFGYAGCPSVLMSLWQADDQEAANLMVNFFEKLDQGENKAQALHQAKLNYLDQANGIKAHPFFWANFMLMGNPQSLPQQPTPWWWILGGVGGLALLAGGWWQMKKRRA